MMEFARRLLADEDGATAIEYGLMASLIFLAIITAVTALGTQLQIPFVNVTGNLG